MRARLFTSLSELLQTTAFENLTLSQIASTAGLGRTAVYNHFADKDQLLIEFIAEKSSEFTAQLKAELNLIPDPVDKLRLYIQEHCKMQLRYHLRIGSELRKTVVHGSYPNMITHAHMVSGLLQEILEQALAAREIPEQDLQQLVTLIYACLSAKTIPSDPVERRAYMEIVECFILRAIGAIPNDCPRGEPQAVAKAKAAAAAVGNDPAQTTA